MNTTPEALQDSEAVAYAPAAETRPFAWSVRRELWENRYLTIAPLAVAAIVLFATFITTISVPMRMRGQDAERVANAIVKPMHIAPAPIMFTALIVAFFYCLDALHGERRDRSILFWKSLPVSDRTTVLAKACIPIVVLPLLAYLLSILAQIVLSFAATAVMVATGRGIGAVLGEIHFFSGLVIMFYGLAVHALWFAPVYGWLLLISAWARRAVLLWAVLPLLAVSAVERIVFGTTYFMNMLQYRMTGAMREAFALNKTIGGNIERINQLTAANFFTRPGLWLGLIFAAACIAAAIRLRRRREPV